MYAREEYSMKKIILLTGAVIILFCIVPISTTQAMQNRAHGHGSIASDQPDAVLSVFNQKELRDIIVELDNPKFKGNLITENIKELRGAVLAQGAGGGGGVSSGKSKGSGSLGNNNQNVHRRGYGRSTMGDEYDADGDEKKKEEESEWPKGEYPKGEYPKGEWPKGEWGDAEYPED
jgi:hypothetical protein